MPPVNQSFRAQLPSPTADAPDFDPAWWLSGGWRQTALTFLPQRSLASDSSTPVLFEVEPGVQVGGHWHAGTHSSAVVLLHGLCGDANSGYLLAAARAFLGRGYGVLRLNARGAGGTLALSRSTYHAAQSSDPVRVADQLARRFGLERVHLVGFSLGGAVALRALVRESVPACLASVLAISPPLDLAAASLRLERGLLERLAGRFFLHHLKGLVEARLQLDPSARARCLRAGHDLTRLRTVRDLDEHFTAPLAGYANAADYYRDASPDLAKGPLPAPALVLQAEDDPLVDPGPARALFHLDRRDLGVCLVPHGGHLGFRDRIWPDRESPWLSSWLVCWIEALETATAPLPGTAR